MLKIAVVFSVISVAIVAVTACTNTVTGTGTGTTSSSSSSGGASSSSGGASSTTSSGGGGSSGTVVGSSTSTTSSGGGTCDNVNGEWFVTGTGSNACEDDTCTLVQGQGDCTVGFNCNSSGYSGTVTGGIVQWTGFNGAHCTAGLDIDKTSGNGSCSTATGSCVFTATKQ